MSGRSFLTLFVLAFCTVALLPAQTRNPAPAFKTAIPAGTGTVQYDPGPPADTLIASTGPAVTIGNRFSSRNGAPLSPGTVSLLSFYVSGNAGSSVLGVFWGPPTGGGGASFISSFGLGGLTNGTFNAFAVGPVPVGSDFLAGIYLPSANPALGQLGARSASTNGQGFHAMQISFNGGAGSAYASIGGLNSMLRATGSIVIPVELIEFEVE